jgi:hypothetical protein
MTGIAFYFYPCKDKNYKMQELNLVSMTKRAYGRYRVDGSATLIGDGGREEPSILKDLSCRGAGIVTYHPLRLNDKLDIIISPSSLFSRPITREARVAWCKPISASLWQGGLDFGETNKISFS